MSDEYDCKRLHTLIIASSVYNEEVVGCYFLYSRSVEF